MADDKQAQTAGKPAKSGPDDAKAAKAVGADQVQETMQEDIDQGFHGVDDDPLKPDGYTLRGSVARKEEPKL